jgi:hypothetical protein
MAPYAASTASTRLGRVLHWLFPSRRAVLAAAALDIAVLLLGLPVPFHLATAIAFHAAWGLWARR